MKKDYTHIVVLLDSSGSMSRIKNDTIGGFNTFLEGQQKTAQDFDTFTFVQFSSGYKHNKASNILSINNNGISYYIHRNTAIKGVKLLTENEFHPSGGTPLYDAFADLIKDTGEYLNSLPEKDKPSRVIFVAITDGEENESRRYNQFGLGELIKHQTEKYNWDFIFLGANQDAILAANRIGISYGSSLTYGANHLGVAAAYSGLTDTVNLRKAGFTADEAVFGSALRTIAMGTDVSSSNTVSKTPETIA